MQDTIDILVALAGDLLSGDDAIRADRLAVAAGAGDAGAAQAALDLARLVGEAADPAGTIAALDRYPPVDAFSHVACLVVACFAVVRADFTARQDAQAARSRMSARADLAYSVAGEFGADVVDWLVGLAGAAVEHLSAVAARRAPVVRVETGISLPSTLLAFDLYGDASRADELVDRNGVSTPLVMPTQFEAVTQ
ncbi:hypothetical protein [Oricola thermophila]|uniref:Mu-like prophage DNA circulation protein n=1 Tax=Oricola thermophila TaxID=2742145 RepID=A0A6N1VHH0_9HYPH|nr:hypothetical protein [Oricola thermophila]QKV20238.1 hypothetical protein HTY61_18165 [Oricola thermophila]